MRRITKLFNTKATSVDEATKTVRFKISDAQPDRAGEIVDQSSWNFKNYLNNPIVLWGHNPDEPENVLGTTVSLDVSDGETHAEMRFDDDINPKAALVWKQILKGTLRTVSVGFINHTAEYENDVPVLKDNELLEISVVPIPANPRAFALALKEGELTRKDAKWLLDSMQRETAQLEEQLKSTNQEGETKVNEEMFNKRFEELTELIKGVGESVAAIEKTQTELTEKVNGLSTTVEELKPAEEEKIEVEEVEEVEGRDEKPNNEDKKPEGEKPKEDKPAKDGDNDQSGAGEDEFDENAELTPEQEAELDALYEADDDAA